MNTSDILRIAPDVETQYARTRLQGGEVLLTLVGTLGEVASVPAALAGWNTARAVAVIPVHTDIGARWVSLALRAPLARHYAHVWATTTVQATLNLRDVARLPVPVPPAAEREAIARILGALEDKIELNRRMNQTLESIVAALFKAWFVDFEPVAVENGDQRAAEPFVRSDAPFSASAAQPSEGLIPLGWRLGVLSDLAGLMRGTINPVRFPTELFEHYSLPAFDTGQIPALEPGDAIKSNKTVLSEDSVLLSKLNPHIPRVWLARLSTGVRSVASTEFLSLVPKGSASLEFVYCLVSSRGFTQTLNERVTGTTGSHQRVPPESLLSIPVLIPSEPVIRAFTGFVAPFLLKVAHNRSQSQTLANMRDALLPKLLSGEVRVREAESLVGAAV